MRTALTALRPQSRMELTAAWRFGDSILMAFEPVAMQILPMYEL